MAINESKLTIQFAESVPDNFVELENDYEVHYNHYGSRGVVDLVRSYKDQGPEGNSYGPWLDVVELKSESAIEQATGANEIVRQFKRHRDYFIDGQSEFDRSGYKGVDYLLVIHATAKTLEHMMEFSEFYTSLESHNVSVIAWDGDVADGFWGRPHFDGWWDRCSYSNEFEELLP